MLASSSKDSREENIQSLYFLPLFRRRFARDGHFSSCEQELPELFKTEIEVFCLLPCFVRLYHQAVRAFRDVARRSDLGV